MSRIPVYEPYLQGNEKKYVNECLDTNWISSRGSFIPRFEETFCRHIGAAYATSVCNGTVALHLAMEALGLKTGDEVIVPTLTYIASVNTIAQTGAVPIFVDSLEATWQMDPDDVRRRITSRTKAVMAVHLYGHPCDMDALATLCQEHGLYLIEDCAEAFGSYYHDRHVGTFGDIATFSFFGNKTITTGEGGMVVCRDERLHDRCAHLKAQGVSSAREYWHDELAYNYRMTNICAAIGLAQLEKVEEILARKRAIADFYAAGLEGLPLSVHRETPGTRHSYWMCSVLLDDASCRDAVRRHLAESGIETRPLFYPAHAMPVFREEVRYPVAESLSARGVNLPSWPGLDQQQIGRIVEEIRASLE